MIRRAFALCIAGGMLASTSAHAGVDEACMSAPVEGQQLHKAGKLIEAHEKFQVCARPTCPAEIVSDCIRWAREVDDATPSVVVAARDAEGRDLEGVRVFIDGAPVTIGVRAIPLDPGPHIFTFKRDGVPDIEDHTLIHEGEKNRSVTATFGRAPGAEHPTATTRPVPASVWILGAVGLLSLGAFATFSAIGISDRAANHCDTGCTQSQKDDVDTKFIVADVTLGVGVVALGVATVLFFARPAIAARAASFDFRAAPGGGVATWTAHF
jgi:hypothetical protein